MCCAYISIDSPACVWLNEDIGGIGLPPSTYIKRLALNKGGRFFFAFFS